MEKEKKGLFGRLLDFWREKISTGETDSIGFWHEKENVEKHFAEMGAVASLTQEEMKRSFWGELASVLEETAEESVLKKEKKLFLAEEEPSDISEEAEKADEKRKKRLSAAEFIRKEKQVETEGESFGRAFLWEMPAEEKENRRIIPVTAEMVREKEPVAEELEKIPKDEMLKKEEKQAEPAVDIETLMREMTKKLWEERESCGRRLR